MPQPIFVKLGMYVMAHEHSSIVYFMNPSHQSVCLYMYPRIVARQRLGKNFTAETNKNTTIGELLDVSFSVRFVRKQLVLPRTSCIKTRLRFIIYYFRFRVLG
jgi:hypothetical protein